MFYYYQCLYRRALGTVFIQFFIRLQKEQQKETKNKKNQLKRETRSEP